MSEAFSSALEDYLEAIAELSDAEGGARVGAIASRVGVHKSTVTAALRSLSEKGLIHYAPYESATLTASGRPIAEEICRRHRVLRRFLRGILGLSTAEAESNACRLEHAVDRACVDRLVCLVEFMDSVEALAEWRERFLAFCRSRRARPSAAEKGSPA